MKARLNGKLTRLCRRTLCVLLAMVIAAALMPNFTVYAAESGSDGSIQWELDDNGVLTISGSGDLLSFPSGLEKAQVSSIVIGEGIADINVNTFTDCKNLVSVRLPSTLTRIRSNAFGGCTALSSINFPDSLTDIGSDAFNGCVSLTSVTIPSSMTSISSRAFFGCSSIASVTIPSSVTYIGEETFAGCTALSSVTVYARCWVRSNGFPSTCNITYTAKLHEATAPTCDQPGNIQYYVCAGGYLYRNYDPVTGECIDSLEEEDCVVPALNHMQNGVKKLEKHDRVPAACTTDGTGEYWECSLCHKKFSDAEGTAEITAPAVIPAVGHNYGSLIAEVPPSHSVNGTKAHYHCSVCGKDFDERKNEITDLTISNAPHGEPDETQWKCDGINHWRICKADGCGEVIESTKAEHTFEWKTDSEPTLAEAGTKHEECTVCGFKRSENTAIEKITYSYTDSGYSWKKRSGKDLAVTVKRSYKDELTAGNFSRLEIDGKTVDSANYSTAPGSVVITLKKSYLESGAVSVGKHTVTAYFSDGGKAETKLTVTSSGSGTTPGTGDDTRTNDLVSVMILFIVSLSFVSYTLYANKLARAKLLAVFSGAQADVQEDGSDDIMPKEHLDDGFDDIIADEPADDGFDDIIPD